MICSKCGKENARYYDRTDGRAGKLCLCAACYAELRREGTAREVCPVCGATFADYRGTGLVGCAACYSAFLGELLPVIRHFQNGNIRHAGKAPSGLAEEKYDRVCSLIDKQARLREKIEDARNAGDAEEAERLTAALGLVNKELYGGEV